MGLTEIAILPHYQILKDQTLDGKRLIEDVALPDSIGRYIYALPDGSYVLIRDGRSEIIGEAYVIHDGTILRYETDHQPNRNESILLGRTAMKKGQLIEKLKQIVSMEKFKMDAYFLCGAATSAPNQSLQKACEMYLETVERSRPDEEITANLVAELEAAVEKNAKIHIIGDLANSAVVIKEVYESREFL